MDSSKQLAKMLDIDMLNSNIATKEQNILHLIMEPYESENIKTQFYIFEHQFKMHFHE